MKRYQGPFLCLILLFFGIVNAYSQGREEKEAVNAIYHWKTTFNPSKEEWKFLNDNAVKRMYVRFFDVDNDPAEPVATTIFKQNLPQDIEIIPTTFITVRGLRGWRWYSDSMRQVRCQELAYKIVGRLLKMAKVQQVEVKEVQFDCDWTSVSEEDFFQLCSFARDTLHRMGIDLSVTIRLHQLNVLDKVPADRGVLMLYNTSNLKNYTWANSILSYDAVKQYLSKVPKTHTLDLDFAYPTYSWGIWFDKWKCFNGILRKVDISNSALYQWKEGLCYEVLQDHKVEGHQLEKGDIIRWEVSDYEEMMKVKNAIESYPALSGSRYSVVIYHLDFNNLSKFSQNEIENIYRH